MRAVASAQPQSAPVRSNNGLRTPGTLGRHPVIGLALVILGSAVFAAIALGLRSNSGMVQLDTQMVNALHDVALRSSPLVVALMIFGFAVGEYMLMVIGAVLVVYFLFKRFWTELLMVLIAWGGETGLWIACSNYFNRQRPVFATEVWHKMTAPSFPSGHSIGAVICYGLLAYMIVPKLTSPLWKAFVIGLALLIIFYVGFSRLFVGDHYPTDVIAGYALGVAWGGLVYTVVESVSRRLKERKSAQSKAT